MLVLTQAIDPRHRAVPGECAVRPHRVVFATVHVVGSENDLQPWAQLPGGDLPDLRLAEFEARKAAALDWIDAAFAAAARDRSAPGVLLMMQAEPTATPGFADIRRADRRARPGLRQAGPARARRRARVRGRAGYAGVPNLTRLETFGDTATYWLRVTVDPRTPAVFAWEAQAI